MRFPSIGSAILQPGEGARRFPWRLALALVARHKLLGVSVPADTYGHLWAIFAFFFHPWFLLSGIPRDYRYLDELDDYPIGIKIFTQFVLIPLVTVYLAILLLYLG